MPHYTLSLADAEATEQLGAAWAACLKPPLVIYLEGDLGAGKTTFTRGLLRGLGYLGAVKSPTYALVESYALPDWHLHHFDLYRFNSPQEWLDAGLDELVGADSVCVIEWPQQGAGFAPAPDIRISLVVQNEGRLCTINADSALGKQSLELWSQSAAATS